MKSLIVTWHGGGVTQLVAALGRLAQGFVHELKVETRERVLPTFKVVRSTPGEPRDPASPDGTSVRTMKHTAVPTGFEPVSPP